MKRLLLLAGLAVLLVPCLSSAQQKPLRVVTTLSTYADIAKRVGGDLVTVDWIVAGDQDPHFVRPRPSLARKLAGADLFVSTGLDLELWVPPLVDISGNPEIRSGQRRYVSASAGVKLLEVPQALSRSEGCVHIWGNPHFIVSPLAAKIVAGNIATGLSRIDPEHAEIYRENLGRFRQEIDRRLFGEKIIAILGNEALEKLAQDPPSLWRFLEGQEYQGKPLLDYLDGWMKRSLAFRGKKAVSYHRLWTYFNDLFGLKMVGEIEPRPGIPPSPRHIERLIETMRAERVGVIVSATYYDLSRVRLVEKALGATSVILPAGTGVDGIESYFDLIDRLVDKMAQAFEQEHS